MGVAWVIFNRLIECRLAGLLDPLLDFLGRSRYPAATPSGRGWIVLDFLGFSRPNRAFSTG
jgi:hypothetical protein